MLERLCDKCSGSSIILVISRESVPSRISPSSSLGLKFHLLLGAARHLQASGGGGAKLINIRTDTCLMSIDMTLYPSACRSGRLL